MRERRSEARMLCADLVEVAWRDGDGRHRKAMALLEDISSAGMCLQLETSLAPGTEVQLTAPKRAFSGCVRYCSYQEIGYFIGVAFEESSRWTRKTYRPRHLLDLKQLVLNSAK